MKKNESSRKVDLIDRDTDKPKGLSNRLKEKIEKHRKYRLARAYGASKNNNKNDLRLLWLALGENSHYGVFFKKH